MLAQLKRLFCNKSHQHEEPQDLDSGVQDGCVSAWADRLAWPTPDPRRYAGSWWWGAWSWGSAYWRFILGEE